LIDNITHAFEVFRTLNIVLKDTHVTERPKSQPVLLVKPIDTIGEQLVDNISEQHVDHLIVRVKQIILID
jgi:hypothetical protein